MSNLLLSGDTHIFAPCCGYSCGEAVVHPEAGKYLIAIGEWGFGLNPFGYRVASAVFGSLAILLMCRIARLLTRSTSLGCIAGLLLSLDGMEFVLSRTGDEAGAGLGTRKWRVLAAGSSAWRAGPRAGPRPSRSYPLLYYCA